jgi:hypothetical protein
MGGGRTDQGGDENDGGEEHVSLHVESFVREKILLDYLYVRARSSSVLRSGEGKMMLPHDIQRALVEVL